MQSDHNIIYKKTADRTGESEQLYKDIGNSVFAELNSSLRRPKSLIIKLKGVGAWFLRRKRMNITVTNFPPTDGHTCQSAGELKLLKDKQELHQIFLDRLKDYEAFIEKRNQIRKIRYASQTLLEPPTEEE